MDSIATSCSIGLSHENELKLHDLLSEERENRSKLYKNGISRTKKKIERAYVKLRDFQFDHDWIVRALIETNDLDTALQWLCLNCTSDELPIRFAGDKATARDKVLQDEGDLKCVAPVNSPPVRVIPEQPPVVLQKFKAKPVDRSRIDTKEWTLRYMEMQDEREAKEEEEAREQERIEKMSPAERYMVELENMNTLVEQAADAKREKNKELQKGVGKQIGDLRRVLVDLEALIPAAELIELQQSKPEKKVSSQQVDTSNDMLSMFEVEEAQDDDVGFGLLEMAEELPTPPAKIEHEGFKYPEKVSTSWTGQVPVKCLEKWSQKRKLRRPKYEKLPGTARGYFRYAVTVNTKPTPYTCTLPDSHKTMDEARQAVANRVLFELNPDVPLYRMFDLHHKEAGVYWNQEIENAKQAIVDQEKKSHDEIIQDIYERGLTTEEAKVVKEVSKPMKSDELESFDDWDADNSDVDSNPEKADEARSEPVKGIPSVSENGRVLQVETEQRELSSAYLKYLPKRNELPVSKFKNEILSLVDNNQVVLIAGSTGCGKTTQVPQYVLQDALHRGQGDQCNIICTQPRRIAAISVAERIKNEMGLSKDGKDSLVGYQIRMESSRGPSTRLLFCTTGVLLRQLQGDPSLKKLSHVIVDEVHERDLQCDFLLVVLRSLIKSSSHLKLILMSATIDQEKFSAYFNRCPVVSIPGRLFPVSQHYLEDIIELTGHMIEDDSPCAFPIDETKDSTIVNVTGAGGRSVRQHVSWTSKATHQPSNAADDHYNQYLNQYSETTQKSMLKVDPSVINYELIEDLLTVLCTQQVEAKGNGSILIFMSGYAEIQTLVDLLLSNREFGDSEKYWILPLHSSVATEDQQGIFMRPPEGTIKIIVSTNIAETSVTIDDVTCVIDTGRVKQMSYDSRRQLNSLQEIWVSAASAKQRMGRAGRVTSGKCYRLYPRHLHLRAHDKPEIQRAPLTDLGLQIKVYGFGSCKSFLAQAMDPPSLELVHEAIVVLREIGALAGTDDDGEGRLTPLGRSLSALPVHVKLGKLMIYGAIFQCLDPILTIAAMMECRSIFVVPYGKQKESQAARQSFMKHQSDLLTDLHAFQCWEREKSRGNQYEKQFCRKYFIHQKTAYEISRMKRRFESLLSQIGFINDSVNTYSTDWSVLAGILAAGLYPNVLSITGSKNKTNRPNFWDRKQQVFLHPSSMAHSASLDVFPSEWMGYHTKVQTSRVFVLSTNPLCSLSLILFGGEIHLEIEKGSLVIDDWIEFQCTGRIGVLLFELRQAMDHILESIFDRQQTLRHREFITTVVTLLKQ